MNNETAKETTTPTAEPKKESGLVGIKCNKRNILAWNFMDGLSVTVSARELKTGLWQVNVESGGRRRASATVLGGRHTAKRFCCYMRKAMFGRAARIKKCHAKRAAANLKERSDLNLLNPEPRTSS